MKGKKVIISMGILGFALGVLNCFSGIITLVNPFASFAARWSADIFSQNDGQLVTCFFLITISTLMFLGIGYLLWLTDVLKSKFIKLVIIIALISSYTFLYTLGMKGSLLAIGV